MNFGQALEALKAGKRVARKGWNGRGAFVYLVPGATVAFENLRGAAKEAAECATRLENGVQGSARYIDGHIDMKAADGSLVIGWLASQTDLLAEDWCIVE